ncbi:hypothetical protein [Microcella sp.]|uniref:hypothetical protein n=1 Tax=Microcella sp. TaxID=1913979 RepID=UPI00299F5F29|nr:hypothetical protein [Microcella sp.]MDX2025137.1 hypothetical protein [Microcella sp.]
MIRIDNAVTFVALHPNDGRVVSDSAVEFYRRYGFTQFVDVDRSLFITLRTFRKRLG